MAIETVAGFSPTIHPSAFIAASADVIGRVTLHDETSVWYQATLRGDINEIVIGPRSNVQDNAVIHLADDYGCYIGELVTVGHSAILHAHKIAFCPKGDNNRSVIGTQNGRVMQTERTERPPLQADESVNKIRHHAALTAFKSGQHLRSFESVFMRLRLLRLEMF